MDKKLTLAMASSCLLTWISLTACGTQTPGLRVYVTNEASGDVSVIDATTDRVVWTAHLPLRPVLTPGAVTLGAAYTLASREVTKELLAAWGPERQPS